MDLKIAICDDEPIFTGRLQEILINEFKNRNKKCRIFTVNNGDDLLRLCSKTHIDAVFLDIVMTGIDGFETAEKLLEINNNIMIVFISNNDSMVYRSFKYNPIWFVPKNQIHLINVVTDKIIVKCQEQEDKHSFQPLKLGSENVIIDVRQLKYFKSDGHYINYFNRNGSQSKSYRCKLTDIEKQLQDMWFVRTHNRFLVNLRAASCISKMKLILYNNEEIPISQAQKEDVCNKLMDYFRSIR